MAEYTKTDALIYYVELLEFQGEINNLQASSIYKFYDLVRHGSKFINLHVRKDGKEYHLEADWLRPFLRGLEKLQMIPSNDQDNMKPTT